MTTYTIQSSPSQGYLKVRFVTDVEYTIVSKLGKWLSPRHYFGRPDQVNTVPADMGRAMLADGVAVLA